MASKKVTNNYIKRCYNLHNVNFLRGADAKIRHTRKICPQIPFRAEKEPPVWGNTLQSVTGWNIIKNFLQI